MFGLSTAKLIGGLVAVLLVIGLLAERSRWMHRAHSAEVELAALCSATRVAADNPKLDCRQVATQVGLLGQTISTLKQGLANQNAAIAQQGATTKAQQTESAKASQAAQERAGKAEAASTRLDASSRAGETQAKPCEPSKALQEAWK